MLDLVWGAFISVHETASMNFRDTSVPCISLPVPLWCRAGSTHPRCSCTVGRAAAADSSHSLRPSPPPPECYQTDCGTGHKQVVNIKHAERRLMSGKKNSRVKRWGFCNRKQTDQSLILCSHSMMSFTCGGPPEPHSFRALRDINGERSVLPCVIISLIV